MVQCWSFTKCLFLQLISLISGYGSSLPEPHQVTMQSVNMRHMLRWRPPQTNCGIVQYSVQFQGEFERLYLNGSWETALDCQQISQHECNLTSDLASDSDYNIRVQAECNNRTSSWASLPAPFNRRDTVLLAPVMSVKVSGDTIQVGFSDLPLSVSVTVDVWRKGNERNVSSHVVTARPSYLSITALQEGATYCLRAQAQLETSTRNKSNNTDTQCVSIHSAPASSPLPITIGIIITVIIIAMAIIMGWSVAHYAYVVKEACSQKDLLPRALLFNWPITGVKLTAEEALEPTHSVVLVHIPDAESPHSKEETQPINSEERRASEREFGV